MPFPFAPDPDALSDRAHEEARWQPERETLEHDDEGKEDRRRRRPDPGARTTA